MYCTYFGLASYPFKTTPDLEMFYKNGSRQEILEALVYTVSRGDGIVKITGEVGSGKTMLLRMLARRLSDQFEIIYINSPNLSAKDILLYICSELGVNHLNDTQKFTLTNLLKNQLLELHSANRKVVMLIDEAQSMTFDVLEELRLLSNIETDTDKLLQMVLFGQPELDVALNEQKIRQFKSRISYSMYVPSLNGSEVHAYLNYRMRKAGYSGLDVFDLHISRKIQKITQGLPRNINVLADKVLMSIYGSGDKFAKNKHLKHIAGSELSNTNTPTGFNKYYLVVSTFLFTIIVSLAYFTLNSNFRSYFLPIDQFNVVSQISSMDIVPVNSENMHTTPRLSYFEPPANDPVSKPNDMIQSTYSDQPNPELQSDTIEYTPIPQGKPILKSDQSNIIKSKQLNYKIANPHALIADEKELHRIMQYHSEGHGWLSSLNDKYVIQLSTRNIRSLDSTIQFHTNNKLIDYPVHIIVDYNKNIDKYRLKVFYTASSSFTALTQVIKQLPSKYKNAQPYVVTVEQLVQNLHYTDKKLQEIGIINE